MAEQHGGGRRFAVAALAVGVLAGACTSGRSTTTTPLPTTTPAPVAQTTTTTDPKQQVIAAYENSLMQYGRVSDDPNGYPNDPILAATMTPQFAKQIQLNLLGLRNLHRYTKGGVIVQALDVQFRGTMATLLLCVRDDSDQYDQNGHDVSGHQGVGTPKQVKAVLFQASGNRWLIDQNSPTGLSCTL